MNPVEFKIYELFHEVLYGGKYNLLAEEFQNRSDILQNEAQKFTASQWRAMNDYLDTFSKVFHTMLTLVLEDNPGGK